MLFTRIIDADEGQFAQIADDQPGRLARIESPIRADQILPSLISHEIQLRPR